MERRRSAIRTAVVWDALEAVLQSAPTRRGHCGSSTSAVAPEGSLSGSASSDTRCWWSTPAPMRWPRSSAASPKQAVTTVRGVLGDADSLLDVVEAGTADLVLCHELLEVVDKPARALEAAAAALDTGGVLSVVAAQRAGAVFSRVLAGHLAEALALLDDPDGRGGSERRPASPVHRGRAARARQRGGVHRHRRARSPDLRRPPQQRRRRLRPGRSRDPARRSSRRRRPGRSSSRSRPSCTCSPAKPEPALRSLAGARRRLGRPDEPGRRHRLPHHPRRHGCLLCLGRTSRPTRAARSAGHRRRRAPRRRPVSDLPSALVRHPLRDADDQSTAALSPGSHRLVPTTSTSAPSPQR